MFIIVNHDRFPDNERMPYLQRDTPCPEPLDCRILTAALDLFVENGYHNVSIHEIQKRANVSIGSIYNHFGGKEGVARALYKHLLNEMDELVDRIASDIESPAAQCREIICRLFEHTETHRNILAFIFHAKHTEFLPDEPLICDAEPFVKIRQIVSRGMACGEFRRMDDQVATATLFGGAIRMIQLRLDGIIERPLPEFLDEVIDAAWSGLKAATHARTRKAKVARAP